MSGDHEFREPDAFTAGTVGPPGQRTFFLQIREAGAIVSLKLEKQQVQALAEFLATVLADLPDLTADDLPLDLGLAEPVTAEWVVGAIGAVYDEERDRILLVVRELIEALDGDEDESGNDDAAEPDGASVRVHLRRPQAAAFIGVAAALSLGGRPPCPLCGRPLDAEGHVCPKSNGHGRLS